MLAGIFHSGSGLGDQLFRYITVRTLAEEKGYEWTILNPQNFKGESFLNIKHFSVPMLNDPYLPQWKEKDIRDAQGNDISSYDPEINFVSDNTIIDGSFEDSKYWHHNLANINKWLAVEPLTVPDDLCVIGFRGGEYATQPDLFLPQEYYTKAMWKMMQKGVKYFQVHTDDPELAKKYFPDCEIIDNTPISHSKHSNMGFNWRSARYAKYAIIPNSAFFIIPRILAHREHVITSPFEGFPDKQMATTIAPRGWARRNLAKGNRAGGFIWARPACYYKEFSYI